MTTPSPDPDDHPFFNLSVKRAEIAARRRAMADPVPVTAPVELMRGNMSSVKIASIYAGKRYDHYGTGEKLDNTKVTRQGRDVGNAASSVADFF